MRIMVHVLQTIQWTHPHIANVLSRNFRNIALFVLRKTVMCRCVLCLPPAQPDAPNCAASGRQRFQPIPFQHLLPSPSSQPEFPCTRPPSSPPQWLRRARGSLDKRPIRLQKPVDCAWSCISMNLGGGVRRGVGWGRGGALRAACQPSRRAGRGLL